MAPTASWRDAVEVVIDHEKCKLPTACMKCAKVCPFDSLMVIPLAPRSVLGREPWGEEWKLVCAFPQECNACGRCVKVCPVNAITILRPETPAEALRMTGASFFGGVASLRRTSKADDKREFIPP